ncbi:MAG: FliH/SctL family protein [Phycisphaerales bacterium]
MPLIRHANLKDLARDAVVLDLGDLRRQSEAMIATAKERAARAVAEGEAERARLIAGAEAEGVARGEAKGLAEGRTRGEREGREAALIEQREALAKLATAWAGGLEVFVGARERLLAEARRDVIRLAAAMARKVTHRAIELDPSVVTAQMEATLRLVMRPTRVSIRVHPEDRALATAALPDVLERLGNGLHATVIDDATLARGSCVVELGDQAGGSAIGGGSGSGSGTIDGEIDGQLDRIVAELLPGSQAPSRTTPPEPGPSATGGPGAVS